MAEIFNSPQFVNWLSTLVMSAGVALLVAGFVSIGSGWLLELAPQTKLWAFIVGFAFLCSLATAPISASDTWGTALLLYTAPLLVVLVYFVPTAVAIAGGSDAFQAIFILNLLFGWTIVGWFYALIWALRPAPVTEKQEYRITPFGAVPYRPGGTTSESATSEHGPKTA